MKRFWVLIAVLFAVSAAQAAGLTDISSTFVNLDFDETEKAVFIGLPSDGGFDDTQVYDVPGWQNLNGTTSDSGVEKEGAWWSPYQEWGAFLVKGDGGYNISSYMVKAGDKLYVSFYAKGWEKYSNTAGAELTITLFSGSDPSDNIIGTFNTGVLTQGDAKEFWTMYEAEFTAPANYAGGLLGVAIQNTSTIGSTFANVDEIQVSVESSITFPSLYIIK